MIDFISFPIIRDDEKIENTTTTSMAFTAVRSSVQLDDFATLTFFNLADSQIQIKPVVMGTNIPVVDLIKICNDCQWDIPVIKNKHPELDEEHIRVVFDYYGNHKKEIDYFLEDFAPELSIADAAQMAKGIIKNLPDDLIDADLGPGL